MKKRSMNDEMGFLKIQDPSPKKSIFKIIIQGFHRLRFYTRHNENFGMFQEVLRVYW